MRRARIEARAALQRGRRRWRGFVERAGPRPAARRAVHGQGQLAAAAAPAGRSACPSRAGVVAGLRRHGRRAAARGRRDLLGKTNCPPYGGGIETDNPVFGRTNNPYDLRARRGGSSGGEAAAVAAGCSAFGLGTDSGGSVRLPAHFCGLASLKPTAGRVPVTGVIDDLGQIGAMQRPAHAGRAPRALGRRRRARAGVIAGPDGRDGGAAGRPARRGRARPPRRTVHRRRPRRRPPRPPQSLAPPPTRCARRARRSRRRRRRPAATRSRSRSGAPTATDAICYDAAAPLGRVRTESCAFGDRST